MTLSGAGPHARELPLRCGKPPIRPSGRFCLNRLWTSLTSSAARRTFSLSHGPGDVIFRMPGTALYFPYIEPPDDAWFRQMLLYWDRVGTILPLGHTLDSGAPLKELLCDGLVVPVSAGQFYREIAEVADHFLVHILDRQKVERRNPAWSRALPAVSEVHTEKLGLLADPLVDAGLAHRLSYDWYEMPEWAADEFMTFLACTLGRLNRKEWQPITNNPHCEALITGAISAPRGFSVSGRTNPLRETLLATLLPSPDSSVPFTEVLKFKQRYAKELSAFRSEIERHSRSLVRITKPEDRLDAARDMAVALKEQRDALEAEMKGRWHTIVFFTALPLIGAAAELSGAAPSEAAGWVSAISSLGAASYGAGQLLRRPPPQPLAYAIKAQQHRPFRRRVQ